MKGLIFLILVIGLGALVAYRVTEQRKAAPAVVTGPGPNDSVLDAEWTPEALAGVFRLRRAERDKVEADIEGRWTPASGWDITVEESHEKSVVGLFGSGSIIGGSFEVICRFGPDHGFNVGDRIKVQGKIAEIETIITVVPEHRIVLEPVRIVK